MGRARTPNRGGVVLGDGLGTLRNGMLGELTRENEPHSSLDFSGGDGVPLVVAGKSTSLRCKTLEDIMNERVHNHHGLLGDSSVGVNLLEHLVDVGGVRGVVGLPLVASLLGATLGLGLLHGLLGGSLLGGLLDGLLSFSRHVDGGYGLIAALGNMSMPNHRL